MNPSTCSLIIILVDGHTAKGRSSSVLFDIGFRPSSKGLEIGKGGLPIQLGIPQLLSTELCGASHDSGPVVAVGEDAHAARGHPTTLVLTIHGTDGLLQPSLVGGCRGGPILARSFHLNPYHVGVEIIGRFESIHQIPHHARCLHGGVGEHIDVHIGEIFSGIFH